MGITEGNCDPAFAAVRDVFETALADGPERGGDLGAAVAVIVGGRTVVDLWGGIADGRRGRHWERDTACVTFSATKPVTATAALLLAERRAVDLDAPVAHWWPEFARHGKETATGAMFLTHQAGLPAFDRPITADAAADPSAMAAQLAGQQPEWAPGTDHGYHALTFGWLAGEIVRRNGGTATVGEFVRREIDPRLRIGVDPEELDGLARIAAPPLVGEPRPAVPHAADSATVARLLEAMRDPDSTMTRSTANPAASFNKSVVLTGGWPAAGLVCTARDLAGFYARLIAGRILAPQTLRDAVRERVRGPDRTMVLETAFGLGFMLPCQSMYLPSSTGSAFGHPGASGALGIGDLDAHVAVGYIPNLSRPGITDRRAHHLVEAVYAAL
jgi:CubicO group peptidase (beta-lactamase class C family)